jgi:hypothetical protein
MQGGVFQYTLYALASEVKGVIIDDNDGKMHMLLLLI